MIYHEKLCEQCPLRLYNDKCYNLKGIGNSIYGNVIIIANVDKKAYKNKSLSFSNSVAKLNETCIPSTGESVIDFCYVTPLIKCKETNNLPVDDTILNRCQKHLVNEIVQLKPRRILLLGSAVRRILNCSIETAINKAILYNGIIYNSNYSPSIELFDTDKFEVFKEYLEKWIYTCKTNDYSGYEKINYDI